MPTKPWREIRKKSGLTDEQRKEDDTWVLQLSRAGRPVARYNRPMKVADLIQKLKDLDPKLEVLCYTEDAALLGKKHSFRLLHIDGVDVAEGERLRTSDGSPTMKFEKGPSSRKIAFLHVTADF